jgi:hypothetical protein
MSDQITIHIRSRTGKRGVARFDAAWRKLAPVAKVLAIHEQCRDVTEGKQFEILMCDGL